MRKDSTRMRSTISGQSLIRLFLVLLLVVNVDGVILSKLRAAVSRFSETVGLAERNVGDDSAPRPLTPGPSQSISPTVSPLTTPSPTQGSTTASPGTSAPIGTPLPTPAPLSFAPTVSPTPGATTIPPTAAPTPGATTATPDTPAPTPVATTAAPVRLEETPDPSPAPTTAPIRVETSSPTTAPVRPSDGPVPTTAPVRLEETSPPTEAPVRPVDTPAPTTPAPTQPREVPSDLTLFLEGLTTDGSLTTDGTPQNQALLDLLAISPPLDPSTDDEARIEVEQLYVLNTLWYATILEGEWIVSDGWPTATDVCTRFGISCTDSGSVVGIDLIENGLNGGIPSEIQFLSSLATLNVANNTELLGEVPIYEGICSTLVSLDASFTVLSGTIPTDIGTCTVLRTLSFSDSFVFGQIPSEIGGAVSLQQFIADASSLTGTLPSEMGNLAELEVLNLAVNNITGLGGPNDLIPIFPTELGSLVALIDLDLRFNLLDGVIPTEIGNLVQLRNLLLASDPAFPTSLSGTVPTEVNLLVNLVRLDLSQNPFLSGILPPMGSLTALEVLNLRRCAFFNNPPTEPDPVPGLSSMVALTFLDLSEQFQILTDPDFFPFVGPLPDVSANSLLQGLFLNGNVFTGPIPTTLGATPLLELDISNNFLSETIPSEIFTISRNLLFFDASGQQRSLNDNFFFGLSGPLPTELFSSSLEALILSDNAFDVRMPAGFGSLSTLTILECQNCGFNGTLVSEIGNLVNLEVLDLASNTLTGPIPTEVGNLQNLVDLQLFENELTGTLPTELGGIEVLQELEVDGNLGLVGPIPVELSSLVNFSSFFFVNTSLTGGVPVEVCTAVASVEGTIIGTCEVCESDSTPDGCCTSCAPLPLVTDGDVDSTAPVAGDVFDERDDPNAGERDPPPSIPSLVMNVGDGTLRRRHRV